MPHTAIIVAGGQGSRLGRETPKAFIAVGDRPMVLYSLATLSTIETIATVIIVVPQGHEATMQDLVDQYGPWSAVVRVVRGGAERQDSVAAGLAEVDDTNELVLIHDAARPFVTRAAINSCIDAALASGAAILAAPANDTIKLADDDGCIGQTLDRDRVWMAQTPQVFRLGLLRGAHAALRAQGGVVTDDAMLIEKLGGRVRLIDGGADNRKITTSADLLWAEWYAQAH